MPATRSRLATLFDTPSSPLAPPSSDSGPQGNTSPPGSPSSQVPTTPTSAHGRFRPSPYSSPHDRGSRPQHRITEDLSQVGALAARKLKLKPESMMALEEFSKIADKRTDVHIFAQLLKIGEVQALAATGTSEYTLPKKLDNKVDIPTFRILMSPNLSYYVKKSGGESPTGMMKALILEHTPGWGITSEQIQEKTVWGVVSSRVRGRFTDLRYSIKKILIHSIWVVVKTEGGEPSLVDRVDPVDIIQLCEELVNIVPDADIKVTLPMLARVAILRQVLIEVSGGSKFWERVDEQLAAIREEPDEARISKNIAKVLKNDCRQYGSPDLAVFN